MADSDSVEIRVDTEVHVPSGATRRVLDAIRRQLRQHDLPAGAEEELRRLLNLVRSGRGGSRLPQALLPRVTEVCRRYGVPILVVDRRAMVACPALRSRRELSPQEDEALRQLLLRDSAVLVAAAEESRKTVAVELAARRQQRTLIAAEDRPGIHRWLDRLAVDLDLAAPHVAALADASADTWVAVGSYDQVGALPADALQRDYGMVICDGLCRVDAVTLMRIIRGVGARYLLGLAAEPVRADGLHQTLFLALGGVGHRISSRTPRSPVRLTLRPRATDFSFPGYEGRRQYQALVAALASDRPRAEAVARDVAEEAGQGHPCLVLSERRDHLELLAGLLPDAVRRRTMTINSTVRLPERQQIISRFERGELTVLLATSQIALESLCTPRLQRVFLTFPFSYARKLEKVIRALMAPAPDQQSAVLYDYDDPAVEPLHRAFKKRAEFLGRLRREAEQAAQLPLF